MQNRLLAWMVLGGWAMAADVPAGPVHDFGKVLPGAQWTHVFVYTNITPQALQVKLIERSCSCLAVDAASTNVAPGKTGTVAVRLYTAGARGPVTESVKLRFAGADPVEKVFAVQAMVQAPVEATPDFVRLSRNPAGRANAFTYVELTNHLASEVILTNAVTSTDRFSAKLEVLQTGRRYRLRIEAIPPFNSGNTFGRIQVNTSLPEFPRLEITAFVPAEK